MAIRGHGLMGKMPEPGRVPTPGGHSLVGEVLALGPYGKAGSGPVQHSGEVPLLGSGRGGHPI